MCAKLDVTRTTSAPAGGRGAAPPPARPPNPPPPPPPRPPLPQTPQPALRNPRARPRRRPPSREPCRILEDLHVLAEDDLVVDGRRLVGPHVEVLNGGRDDGCEGDFFE